MKIQGSGPRRYRWGGRFPGIVPAGGKLRREYPILSFLLGWITQSAAKGLQDPAGRIRVLAGRLLQWRRNAKVMAVSAGTRQHAALPDGTRQPEAAGKAAAERGEPGDPGRQG